MSYSNYRYVNLFAFFFCSGWGVVMMVTQHPLVALVDFALATLNLVLFFAHSNLRRRLRGKTKDGHQR